MKIEHIPEDCKPIVLKYVVDTQSICFIAHSRRLHSDRPEICCIGRDSDALDSCELNQGTFLFSDPPRCFAGRSPEERSTHAGQAGQ